MNRFFTIVIVFTGCADAPNVTSVCRQMCTTATELYGGCLETWGMGWSDAGYQHAAAHQESCEVWSWEIAELHGRDASERLCEDRVEILRNGECDDYTEINWNEMP